MEINKINPISFILSDFILKKTLNNEEVTGEISSKFQFDYDDIPLLNINFNDFKLSNIASEENIKTIDSSTLNSNSEIVQDNIDWNALSLDGKGINIANMAKLLYTSLQNEIKQNGKSGALKDSVLNILTSGTSEEKDAVAKLFSYPTVNKSYDVLDKARSLFNSPNKMKSEAEVLAKLASLDKDGDGFLSDNEIENISKNKYCTNFGLQEDGVTLASCGGLCAKKFSSYGITTINGQKCYCINEIVLTEEEFLKLDSYYKKNGAEASFSGALEAMGIKNQKYVEKGQETTSQKNYIDFIGASGVTSEILTSKRTGKNNKDISEDKQLWLLYMGIKYKFGV